ncbi:MAG: hypothetical protein ACK5C5_11475 [Bacteroidota bacterium]|jgi:hypothetical protein
MKLFKSNIFIMLFVSVPSLLSSYDSTAMEPPRTVHFISAKPKVSICFTIARKRDCEGFGICNFRATLSEGRSNNVIATVTKDDYSNAIVFEINRTTGLTANAYDRYFKSGFFVMEDDSPVPSDILTDLGISNSAILIQGRYPVVESNGILRFVISYR